MPKTSLSDDILVEVGAALLPITRANSPQRAIALLSELGYEFPGAQDLVGAMKTVAAPSKPVRKAIDVLLGAETTQDLLIAGAALSTAVKVGMTAIQEFAHPSS